jgi:hypothetical protein
LTTLCTRTHDGRSPVGHHRGLRFLVEFYALRHILGEFLQVLVIRSSLLDDDLLVDGAPVVLDLERVVPLSKS